MAFPIAARLLLEEGPGMRAAESWSINDFSMSSRFAAALMLLASGPLAAGAQAAPSALQRLTLLDAKELTGAIERGDAVTVTIDTPEKTEIATLGVVRLEVPRSFYVDHVRELTGFLSTGAMLESGTLGEPARLEGCHHADARSFGRESTPEVPTAQVRCEATGAGNGALSHGARQNARSAFPR